jgi:hypothetical protein
MENYVLCRMWVGFGGLDLRLDLGPRRDDGLVKTYLEASASLQRSIRKISVILQELGPWAVIVAIKGH